MFTPPLVIFSPLESPSNSEQNEIFAPSLSQEFKEIQRKSQNLFDGEKNLELRKKSERKSPLFFEEAEEIREIERRERFHQRSEKTKSIFGKKEKKKKEKKEESSSWKEKRKDLLIEALKYKMWRKLNVKARCRKRESVVLDIIGEEDGEMISELFKESDKFALFSSSSGSEPVSSLQHHKKFLVWKVKIYSSNQVGDWLEPLLLCYKQKHFAEVQFHSGVLSAPPTPMEVSLHLCRAYSWVTRDVLGKEIVESERRECVCYLLTLSFRVSFSRISYETDSE
jgi:hypothetical protein